MNTSPSSQRFLLIGAWIGTAVLAYSLGHLGAPSALPVQSDAAGATGSKSVAPSNGFATGENAAGERPLDGGHGLTGTSLDSIIGNQPLGDYLKRILTLDDDIKRTTAFMQILETLKTVEEIQAALDAVAKSGRGWGRGVASREFSMLLQKWTTIDPKGAAEYAVKATGREERYMATSAVLKTWMRSDLEGALAWARTNGVPPAGDPNTQQRGEGDGNYAVAMIAAQIARTDVSRALAIAGEDANSRTTTRLTDTLVEELFKQHGEPAARDAILAMPESKLRDSMIGEHADRLAKTDGIGAAQFAASLPPGNARSRALSEAISGWADDDPAAAGNFLNTLPPSADSDGARERFARQVLTKDPVGALSWAGTISNPQERQDTTEKLIQSWLKSDGETAKTWVLQSPLTEEAKQRLLAPAGRGRN